MMPLTLANARPRPRVAEKSQARSPDVETAEL
jgi:hypothetical protein